MHQSSLMISLSTSGGSEAWCVENLGFAKPLVLRPIACSKADRLATIFWAWRTEEKPFCVAQDPARRVFRGAHRNALGPAPGWTA